MQVKVLYQWHRMEKQTFSSQRGEQSSNLKPFPGGYCSTIQISVSEVRIHLQCPRIHIKATLGQHLYHWQNNYQIFWWTKLTELHIYLEQLEREAHLISSAKIISISHLHRQNFMSHASCNSDPRVQIVGDWGRSKCHYCLRLLFSSHLIFHSYDPWSGFSYLPL